MVRVVFLKLLLIAWKNMQTTKKRNVSRRVFLKEAARMGLLTAAGGPFFVFPERAQASQKRLRILQWKHFIPGYDKWFSEVFARDWGHKYDTKVIVDHIPREKIRRRAAAEVAAARRRIFSRGMWSTITLVSYL